jgi:neutral ceramidase
VQSADGKPLALLANYSLHYVGGVGPGHISADYFGAFAVKIGQLLGAGPEFVGIMSNGTSGDINNIDFRGGQAKEAPYGRIQIVANDVAQAVAAAVKTVKHARLGAARVSRRRKSSSVCASRLLTRSKRPAR